MLGSIESGPILKYPLIEHNVDRRVRPVRLNIRKVRGKRGWLLQRCGRFLADDPSPAALGHHAIQIGGYAYELHTDEANQKYLMVQRLTGAQIWMPTVTEAVVGYCDLTDEEIAIDAIKVQSWMRSRQEGRYHVKYNNCQHFTEELWRRICINDYSVDTKNLASLGSIARKFTREWEGSKEASLLSGITIQVDECSEKSVSLDDNVF